MANLYHKKLKGTLAYHSTEDQKEVFHKSVKKILLTDISRLDDYDLKFITRNIFAFINARHSLYAFSLTGDKESIHKVINHQVKSYSFLANLWGIRECSAYSFNLLVDEFIKIFEINRNEETENVFKHLCQLNVITDKIIKVFNKDTRSFYLLCKFGE